MPKGAAPLTGAAPFGVVLAHHWGSWLTIDGEPGPLMIS